MTRTAKRVNAIRQVRDIHAYKSAQKGGEWLRDGIKKTPLGAVNLFGKLLTLAI